MHFTLTKITSVPGADVCSPACIPNFYNFHVSHYPGLCTYVPLSATLEKFDGCFLAITDSSEMVGVNMKQMFAYVGGCDISQS